jgi:hypothetical protein
VLFYDNTFSIFDLVSTNKHLLNRLTYHCLVQDLLPAAYDTCYWSATCKCMVS